MRLPHYCCLLILCCLLPGFLVACKKKAPGAHLSPKEQEELIRKMMAEQNGPLSVTINLVDEAGQPVKGVEATGGITITQGWVPPKDESQQSTVNGVYHIEHPHCAAITVEFRHPEYGGERLVFMYRKPYPNMKMLNGIQTYDMTLALKKKGKVGNMTGFSADLSWHPERGYRVMKIKDIGKYRDVVENFLYNVQDANNLSPLPRLHLDLIPSKLPKPSIIDENRKEPVSPPDKDAYLVLDDETDDCGFIIFDTEEVFSRYVGPKKIEAQTDEQLLRAGKKTERDRAINSARRTLKQRLLREMKSAPEHGYQKRIQIPDGLWLRGYPFVFYFKMNGHYGKGNIRTVDYDRNDRHVGVSLEFEIELDGTRNVTTDDGEVLIQ